MAQNTTKVFTSPQYFTHRQRHSQLRTQRDHRCRAGEERQNQFGQFLQWGASLIRKTLVTETPNDGRGPTSARRRNPSGESPPVEEVSAESVPQEASEGPSSTTAGLREDEGVGSRRAEEAKPNPDGLDERREAYQHLVAAGGEITHDWPPKGTPTWQDWLEGMDYTENAEAEVGSLKRRLDDAIALENYKLAATLNKELQALLEKDQVASMYKEYEAALEAEDYEAAARLSEEGHLGLPGWWKVGDSSVKNPDHLLCVIPAYGRLVFKAYDPQDLAKLYGASAPTPGSELVTQKDLALLMAPVRPTREALWDAGRTVAELHFLRFRADAGDRLLDGTELQEGAIVRQSVMCAHLEAEDGPRAAGGGATVAFVGATVSVDGGPETSLEDYLAQSEPSSSQKKEGESKEEKATSDADFRKKLEADLRSVLDSNRTLTSGSTNEEAQGEPAQLSMELELPSTIRLPTQLTRFGRDNSRMMLRIPELPRAEDAGPADHERKAEEMLEGAEIVPLRFEGGEVPTAKQIMERLQDVLRARDPEGGKSSPGAVLDMQPEKAEANAEALGKLMKGGEGPAIDKAEMLKLVAEAIARSAAPKNLSGSISYKRLHLQQSSSDPFTGLFAGHFAAHGFEILDLQRTVGEDKETYVEATKVTGDNNVGAGSVAFKVPIGAKNADLGGMNLGSGTAYVDMYKGQGRVSRPNNVDARWVDGLLMHFKTPNAFSKGAHLGFHYMVSQQKQSLVLLSRLQLDDLAARQEIPLGCCRQDSLSQL